MAYVPEGGFVAVKNLYDLLVRSNLIDTSSVADFGDDIQKRLGKRVIDVPCEGVTTKTVPSVSSSDARAICEAYKAEKAKREESSRLEKI